MIGHDGHDSYVPYFGRHYTRSYCTPLCRYLSVQFYSGNLNHNINDINYQSLLNARTTKTGQSSGVTVVYVYNLVGNSGNPVVIVFSVVIVCGADSAGKKVYCNQ
jgi:hypothetical protein